MANNKTTWWAALLVLACAGAQEFPLRSVQIPDAPSLLLAHFDGTLLDEISGNEAKASGPLPFCRGKFGKGVCFPRDSKEILSFAPKLPWAEGAGTLSLWIRLDWEPRTNVTSGRTIVDIFTRNEKANRARLYLYANGEKSPGTHLFLVLSDAAGKSISHGVDLGQDAKWRAGDWHHLVVSWMRGKGIVFALDGAAQKIGKPGENWEMDLTACEIFVGMPFYAASRLAQGKPVPPLEGALDELMISRQALLAFP